MTPQDEKDQIALAHAALDDIGAPREDGAGTLSLTGRCWGLSNRWAEEHANLLAEVAQLRQDRDNCEHGYQDQIRLYNEMRAARDRLRARLRQQAEFWSDKAHSKEALARANAYEHQSLAMQLLSDATQLRLCAADLLAVLTEPPQQENDEKTNTNAVSRSAETDVIREVALPQRED